MEQVNDTGVRAAGPRAGTAGAPARRRRPGWIAPLMATAVAILLGGLWEGLVYLGLPLPAGTGAMSQDHGQLMVLGFLGTLIALERAAALGRPWGYLAPAAAGAGGLAIIAGAPGGAGEALIGCGGVMLAVIFAAVYRIQPSLHNAVLASAALCWVVAAGLWLAGWDISRFVPWLAGFLVLTITGERLELSRMTGTSRRGRLLFAGAAGLFGAGLLASLAADPAGIRVTGAGLIALALWLARYDMAVGRRGADDRRPGLRRRTARHLPGLRDVDDLRPRPGHRARRPRPPAAVPALPVRPARAAARLADPAAGRRGLGRRHRRVAVGGARSTRWPSWRSVPCRRRW